MIRQFGEKDRIKKSARVILKSVSLAPSDTDGQLRLETAIKAALDDGFLPCATAFGIAKRLAVPRVMIGDATDRLGVGITNCPFVMPASQCVISCKVRDGPNLADGHSLPCCVSLSTATKVRSVKSWAAHPGAHCRCAKRNPKSEEECLRRHLNKYGESAPYLKWHVL